MKTTKNKDCISFHVDPSPHLPKDAIVKDVYGNVVKEGDKVLLTLKPSWAEGYVEKKDGVLYVRVISAYNEIEGVRDFYGEKQKSYELINNFINRCYTVRILNQED